MGQDEQALAFVARADFSRREQSSRNAVTHAFQVFVDLSEPQTKMVGDVFQEDRAGPHVADNSGDVGPEVAGIVDAASPAGEAERLARIASRDEIHDAPPWSAVEGG